VTHPSLALTGVSKSYGSVHALNDISLQASAGERLALVGHNGAGKTTLFKLLLSILRPDRGEIQVLGKSPQAARAAGSIGFLPETIAFDPAMRGIEALRFWARLKGLPGSVAEEAMEKVGLGEAKRRPVRSYSKGMRQRLGFAQAILGDPHLLLLDEPTTGLDPAFRRIFYDLIRERAEAGASVVISSHALSELEAETDRIAILGGGRLLALGSLDEIRREVRLPVMLRVVPGPCRSSDIAATVAPEASVTRRSGEAVELACEPEAKMAVIRRLAGLGEGVKDIEVLPPSLDAIYAQVTAGRAP